MIPHNIQVEKAGAVIIAKFKRFSLSKVDFFAFIPYF
jgi:hypothetical protein